MKKYLILLGSAGFAAFFFCSCDSEEPLKPFNPKEWLEERGVVCDERTIMQAVNNNDAMVLQTLILAHRPYHSEISSVYDKLVKLREYGKALFMVKCGYEPRIFPSELISAIVKGDMPYFKFLLACNPDVNEYEEYGEYAFCTLLSVAIEKRKLPYVKLLIKAGADYKNAFEKALRAKKPDSKIIKYLSTLPGIDTCGASELAIAIVSDDIAKVKRLCKKRNSINKIDEYGKTPLTWACEYNKPESVRLLLNAGADVNQPDRYTTPLHRAAACSPEIVKMLLDAGSEVNVENVGGNIPLHVAAGSGQHDCMVLLINAGSKIDYVNKDGKTPADCAKEGKHYECIKVLNASGAALGNGADKDDYLFEVLRKGDATALQALLKDGIDLKFIFRKKEHQLHIRGRDYEECTPLQIAAYYGHAECVRLLVSAGMDVNYSRELTPLVFAVYGSTQDESKKKQYIKCVKTLLDCGAKVDYRYSGNTHAYSPSVLVATRFNQPEILAMLIQAGAEIKNGKLYDPSPLYFAAEAGCKKCVELLLAAGVDPCRGIIDINNERQMQPLYIAAYNGHADCVKQLISAGADINFFNSGCVGRDEKGTALYAAAERNHIQCVKCLLDGGANPDIKRYHHTALSIAAQKGYVECVKLLIEHGADVNSGGDYKEDTPLCAAAENGQVECVKLLIAAGVDVNKSFGSSAFSRAKKKGHTQCAELIRKAGGRAK